MIKLILQVLLVAVGCSAVGAEILHLASSEEFTSKDAQIKVRELIRAYQRNARLHDGLARTYDEAFENIGVGPDVLSQPISFCQSLLSHFYIPKESQLPIWGVDFLSHRVMLDGLQKNFSLIDRLDWEVAQFIASHRDAFEFSSTAFPDELLNNVILPPTFFKNVSTSQRLTPRIARLSSLKRANLLMKSVNDFFTNLKWAKAPQFLPATRQKTYMVIHEWVSDPQNQMESVNIHLVNGKFEGDQHFDIKVVDVVYKGDPHEVSFLAMREHYAKAISPLTEFPSGIKADLVLKLAKAMADLNAL